MNIQPYHTSVTSPTLVLQGISPYHPPALQDLFVAKLIQFPIIKSKQVSTSFDFLCPAGPVCGCPRARALAAGSTAVVHECLPHPHAAAQGRASGRAAGDPYK